MIRDSVCGAKALVLVDSDCLTGQPTAEHSLQSQDQKQKRMWLCVRSWFRTVHLHVCNDAALLTRQVAQVSVDDRTEQRRLTGSQIKELKSKRKKVGGALELILWTGRNNPDDLQKIKEVLREYPGKVPVLMHIQSGAGKRATIELPESFNVNLNPALQRELAGWMG